METVDDDLGEPAEALGGYEGDLAGQPEAPGSVADPDLFEHPDPDPYRAKYRPK